MKLKIRKDNLLLKHLFRIFGYIVKHMDWPAIVIGIVAIMFFFVAPQNKLWQNLGNIAGYIAGFLGIYYIVYAFYLWIVRRVDFDVHLVNGHFLHKVICLVLLLPFTIACLLSFTDITPIELGFERNLYSPDDLQKGNSILSSQESPSLFWMVYYHFIDPGNQHMTISKFARGVVSIIAILGVFLLNGLLVSSIIGWLDKRKEGWENGEVRYQLRHLGKFRFAVVIGANEISIAVIKNLFTQKKEGAINFKCEGSNRYVLLQTSRDVKQVREELASHLSVSELNRVVIYKALRDSAAEIKHLYVDFCTEIYVLGESTVQHGGESYHDAMNMRCVNIIAAHLEKNRETKEKLRQLCKLGDRSIRRVCKVLFEYQTTYSILQFSDITEEVKNNLVFIPFNRFDSWARTVMVEGVSRYETINAEMGEIHYTPLDGDGIAPEDSKHVHLVVVGMSKMGVAIGIQALEQCHYLNFAKAQMLNDADLCEVVKNNTRTRITFIDSNMEKEMAFFKGRYANLFSLVRHRYVDTETCDRSHLLADSSEGWIDPMQDSECRWKHLSYGGKNFLDIEIEFLKGDLESEGIRAYLNHISNGKNKWVETSKLTMAICLTQTHQAIAASLYMPIVIYEKAQEIWVYQRESADIIQNLTNTKQEDKRYKKLRAFGMLYGEYMSDQTQYLKSLLVNAAYDLNGKDIKIEDRDMSRKDTYSDLRATWKILSLDKKFSNVYYADSISQKIRSAMKGHSEQSLKNALLLCEEELARCEHNRWNVQQLLLGYSPCTEEIDKIFSTLNSHRNTQRAKDIRDKWRMEVGWKSMSPIQKIQAKNDLKYLATPHGIFDLQKKHFKEGEDRMHPNICDYAHLDEVDSDAKGYDIFINNAIPEIIGLLDRSYK